MFTLEANLVDIPGRRTYPARITVVSGRIAAIEAIEADVTGFVLPGFVDAHVHVESSMLIPSEFARMAVLHGTVGTVSDPHEIANVLGIEGVRYMLANGSQVPFKFGFGAPSCVPATQFETAGAALDAAQVAQLLALPEIYYLAEMMNYPGVLHGDPEVMAKITAAQAAGKPVDGHAPGLRGQAAAQYIAAGISTDHECFTADEALDKLRLGMKILIREGSAAKNFEALHPLIPEHWPNMMFCSDDKHPDELAISHINALVARAVALGYDLYAVLSMACIHPVLHYGLPIGLLRVGDPADMILVEDLQDFRVLHTWLDGHLVAQNGRCLLDPVPATTPNAFAIGPISPADLAIRATSDRIRVIEAIDGELITRCLEMTASIQDGCWVSDPSRDLLKIVVINRYKVAPPAIAFIHRIGLQTGALASSVAHDSHNIIAVGADDEALCQAINLVIGAKGGVAAVGQGRQVIVPLPVAGLMSDQNGHLVARQYTEAHLLAKALGSPLRSPFMTLSFMALLVIPSLKLSDLGLFDGQKFEWTTNGL